nr:ribonuclease H-like domain-containing protein [Tanacetum cinerariifolium]
MFNIFNDSSEDFLEDLFSNQPSGNPTFSSHSELTSPEVNDDIFDSEGGNVLLEKLLDLDSTKDFHPPLHFDIESDLKEIEFMLHQDIDSNLKDSIDQSNLADIFVDSMPDMFTDEHALDYSSPLIFDEYDDDFLEVESDAKNGNPQYALKDKGVIDSGCSRHITGNMSYLSDFEDLNERYVAFGGNLAGGKITGKGKIKTCKLDFEDVYFVRELKFNLFSVSKMCAKKNSVLFTDT